VVPRSSVFVFKRQSLTVVTPKIYLVEILYPIDSSFGIGQLFRLVRLERIGHSLCDCYSNIRAEFSRQQEKFVCILRGTVDFNETLEVIAFRRLKNQAIFRTAYSRDDSSHCSIKLSKAGSGTSMVTRRMGTVCPNRKCFSRYAAGPDCR
jgi:hypothetical protein